ncbi:MAG: hypothetical protein K8I27_01640 [Planctomycetes bacterium]|nr:hypothetical protein [Planctomycetota bacterium]
MPASGEGDRCIICGNSLLLETVSNWRKVYHPYSYADAMLAHATLQAHGLTARHLHSNMERVLCSNAGGVIVVAEGEHLFAQEVLRQLRGVRTDTEYMEWQECKQRKARRRRIIMGAVAATAALGAAAVLGLILDGRLTPEPETAQEHR